MLLKLKLNAKRNCNVNRFQESHRQERRRQETQGQERQGQETQGQENRRHQEFSVQRVSRMHQESHCHQEGSQSCLPTNKCR